MPVQRWPLPEQLKARILARVGSVRERQFSRVPGSGAAAAVEAARPRILAEVTLQTPY